MKEKQRAVLEVKKEIADLDNGHVDLDDVLAEPKEPKKNGRRDLLLERVGKVEAANEDKALDDELKDAKKTISKDRELANYVGGAAKAAFAGMAQDVKNGRK